MDSSAGAIFR